MIKSRVAFTLVELLVVVAIIGILMALVLPAVQAAREAARRIQCASQLKQLGLAVLNYESSRQKLPPSGIVDDSLRRFDPRSGVMHSWAVLILPYIEQRPLYDRFDRETSILQHSGDPQATHVEIMHCPSDSAGDRFFVDAELTEGKQFAKGNYAAFVSPVHTDTQARFPGALVRFGQKLALVSDGTSSTLMLSEVRTRDQPQDQRGAWALPWTGASLLAFDMHPDLRSPGAYEANEISRGYTQRPNSQGPPFDMLYACPDSADAQMRGMPCGVWDPGRRATDFLSAAPRSNHPGGVNAVFADGHVEFLSDDVNEFTMAYMISANDGHPRPVSQFEQ